MSLDIPRYVLLIAFSTISTISFLWAGCSSSDSGPSAVETDGGLDAPWDRVIPPPPDTGPKPLCDKAKPFETVKRVFGLPENSYAARLTPDELTIYFHTSTKGPNGEGAGALDLVMATREKVTDAFSNPIWLTGINAAGDEADSIIAPDRKSLIFTSKPAGGAGKWSIFLSQRGSTAEPFRRPNSSLVVTNASVNEGQPFLRGESDFWLSSEASGNGDLYEGNFAGGTVTSAVAVRELNDPNAWDGYPTLNEDGLSIFFASARGVSPASEIWRATRASTDVAFSAPKVVEELRGGTGDNWPTWLSSDECRLYITSSRTGAWVISVATRPL